MGSDATRDASRTDAATAPETVDEPAGGADRHGGWTKARAGEPVTPRTFDGGLADLSTAIRWGVLSLVLLGALLGHESRRTVEAAAVLVFYAIFRTVSPIGRRTHRSWRPLAFGLEAALCLVAVVFCGTWSTPFVLALGATLMIAGLEGGAVSVCSGVAAVILGSTAWLAWTGRWAEGGLVLECVAVFVLVGGIGAYGGKLHADAVSRVSDLAGLRSAAEERGRVARELHDRLGQSLAAVGFALEHLADRSARIGPTPDGDLSGELRNLADDVRYVYRQMREQLSDLRSDPLVGVDLTGAIAGLLARVELRSAVHTVLVHDGAARLPPAVEHEVWRIAQEAVINAERHAHATSIVVRWACDGQAGLLEVVDDGSGLPDRPPRHDAYGIVGMRERADAIKASLDITSTADRGTCVALKLPGVRR